MTPASPADLTTPPRRKKSRRGLGLFVLSLAVMALAAAFLSPLLPPLPGSSDDAVIAHQRAQRRFRATWGLPLPGTPDLANLSRRLAENAVVQGAPVFVRIFKQEFELELWMKRDGVFHRFATYPICRWSGGLGPKIQQGDRQAPEGFYTVDARSLNPNSRWYRSFNLGFPNAYDLAHKRTGSLIMVHGGCGSVGCFAMTNGQIDEIWRLITAAFDGGQKRFQVQVLPFRMSDEKLARYSGHPAAAFWRMLKRGNDLFEANLLPPRVHVCKGEYGFDAAGPYKDGDGLIENRCPVAAAKS